MNYYIKKLQSDEYVDEVDTWEAFDEIAEALGPVEFLNALAKAMSRDDLQENMRYIIRSYDLAHDED